VLVFPGKAKTRQNSSNVAARGSSSGPDRLSSVWNSAKQIASHVGMIAKVQSARARQIGAETARRTWANTRVLTAVAWENGKIRISLALKNSSKLLCSAWRNASLHSSSAWRNFRAQQISRSNSKRLHVAETISLGEKRFVAVIKVDGREFLVGGGSSNVSLLAQLTGKESKESFDELLTEKMAAPEMPVPKKQPAKQARKRVAKPTAAQAVEQA
jgi:flagellar biogenesis protein FliO